MKRTITNFFKNNSNLQEWKFINRYRRWLETCPQAKTSKSGHAIFFSFFRCVRATSMTQRRVENTRVHFWTFSPVSVNSLDILGVRRLGKNSFCSNYISVLISSVFYTEIEYLGHINWMLIIKQNFLYGFINGRCNSQLPDIFLKMPF